MVLDIVGRLIVYVGGGEEYESATCACYPVELHKPMKNMCGRKIELQKLFKFFFSENSI